MVEVTVELAHPLQFDYEKTKCFVTVAERHGVDRRTVKAYVEQHKKHGRQQLKRTRQRKKVISSEAAQAGVELLNDRGHGICRSVAKLLHEQGLVDRVVHRTTLAKAAKAAAAASGIPLRVERGLQWPGHLHLGAAARQRTLVTKVGQQQQFPFHMASTPPQWSCWPSGLPTALTCAPLKTSGP